MLWTETPRAGLDVAKPRNDVDESPARVAERMHEYLHQATNDLRLGIEELEDAALIPAGLLAHLPVMPQIGLVH